MPSRSWLAPALFAILIAASPQAYAEEDMSWTVNRFESDTPDGTPMAVLHYGIPETDAVAFEATCGGPDGPEPRVVFWYDITDFAEGDDVSLEIIAGEFEDALPAKVYGKELEVGVSGIQASVDTEAPLWAAMTSNPDLTYALAGGNAEKLRLNGAADAVGAFTSACRATASITSPDLGAAAGPIDSGTSKPDGPDVAISADADMAAAASNEDSRTQAVKDDADAAADMDAMASDAMNAAATGASEASADEMPAPEMPAGGPFNPEAEVVSCEKFGTIKSMESDTPLNVTFVNLSDGYRGVVWIGPDGTPVDKGSLGQSESMTVETFKDHVWMLTDGPGNCIEMFVPKNDGDTLFEIKKPSPIFGDEED